LLLLLCKSLHLNDWRHPMVVIAGNSRAMLLVLSVCAHDCIGLAI
jgi:hypothetical protein